MKKEIIEEIMKECNWWEKIFVKLFTKTCIKIYHISRINTVNSMLKSNTTKVIKKPEKIQR